ncbi:MAG TPA: thioesterase family protein [Dinghuibacter sp.]|jgi:acyl-CoA thioester hydrolase|uniref:acyl-CoA thioesterase n=1 Tax=Dinghuibacter sp. TaxID=2024697 RepID=UPI002D0E3D83|nr:thioesterase family protein [Dinghuibacter sp.]HTJ10657.1 thioesterase family protein [Dinghuibacter sp.]
MSAYQQAVEVRWSDLDPNFHLRHSVYYDWGAYVRLSYLNGEGITPMFLLQHQVGPILFREECVFKREVVFGDKVDLNIQLLKSRRDASRWTMRHEVWKNGDTLAAVITIDGAWLDTAKRKLAIPPKEILDLYERFPKSEGFVWEEVP